MNNPSVYIHVPFCRRKCNYCDFYSSPATPGEVSSYAKALCNQIRNGSGGGETAPCNQIRNGSGGGETAPCNQIRNGFRVGEKIHTVYFGGGTPSLLSREDFTSIVSALRETFDLSRCAEFTVECNPESVTPALAEVWRNSGVNRISMGVQTFSDSQLSLLGRLHTGQRALEAYRELRSAGFDNISLDLMAALPGQSESALREDLQRMLSLSPEHLSVYLLKIEPGSAFGLKGISEADEETQRSMYLLTHEILTARGYEHYEISNFAKPGFRAKHNGVYWNGGEYLAFGPGASGFYGGVRYHIPANTPEFCEKNGLVSPVLDETVDMEESRRERIFLGLRLRDGIERTLIPREKESFVRALCDRGYGLLTPDRFALTPEGFLISDYVIRELLPSPSRDS